MAGKVICLDPDHGGAAMSNSCRGGPSGEREEWIDRCVALALRELLEQRRATGLLTSTEDADVPLAPREQLAVDGAADLFPSTATPPQIQR